jgi:peptide/nickel transport system ATP-binding protein
MAEVSAMAGSGNAHLRPEQPLLLEAEQVSVVYPMGGRDDVRAVTDVSLDVSEGEVIGIVGESGCGKSSLARAILHLPSPTSGTVRLAGSEPSSLGRRQMRDLRRGFQMIFQDPIASLNPRRTVGASLEEAARASGDGSSDEDRVRRALERVGLDPDAVVDRFPTQFSGGQAQRICIARALLLEPSLLVCDEAVSALDVSVQAQILNLLLDLKDDGLAMVFISHDLGVVWTLADRVAVMFGGMLCEVGSVPEVMGSPKHPYTLELLEAVTDLGADVEAAGTVEPLTDDERPDQGAGSDQAGGCVFRSRCPNASDLCASEQPTIERVGDDQFVACHHPVGSVVSEGGPAA